MYPPDSGCHLRWSSARRVGLATVMGVTSTRVVKTVALLVDEESEFRANRLQAMASYAAAMGWTIHICLPPELAPALAGRSFDLVLCWRLSELPEAEALYAVCRQHGVDILPLAQSCSALAE